MPVSEGDGGGGMGTGMVVGVIVVILIIIGLFIIFGRGETPATTGPAAPEEAGTQEGARTQEDAGAEVNLPSAVDLNVNQGQQPASEGAMEKKVSPQP
ncbi:MAG: hypothetical protein AAB538_05870 [Patescibacteria group bacterium]